MSTNQSDDPVLKALEGRLAGLTPQLSPAAQQDLLYQCAFAAGKQSLARSLRRWQAGVAALALLLVSLSVPLASNQWTVARHEPQRQPAPTAPQIVAAEPATDSVRPVVPLGQFDAWKIALSSSDTVASNLKQLQRIEPESRSLAVGALTRAALQQ